MSSGLWLLVYVTLQRLVELAIAQRNTVRRPYKFLVPSGIPQSINI